MCVRLDGKFPFVFFAPLVAAVAERDDPMQSTLRVENMDMRANLGHRIAPVASAHHVRRGVVALVLQVVSHPMLEPWPAIWTTSMPARAVDVRNAHVPHTERLREPTLAGVTKRAGRVMMRRG